MEGLKVPNWTTRASLPAPSPFAPCQPLAGPQSGQLDKSSGHCPAQTASGTATSPFGHRVSSWSLPAAWSREENTRRKGRACLDPRALLVPGVPLPGGLHVALRLPACCLFGLEKLPQRRNLGADRFRDKVGKIFFARCVRACVRVCFHFVRRLPLSASFSVISRRGAQSLHGQLQHQEGNSGQGG